LSWLKQIDPEWMVAVIGTLFAWWKTRNNGLTNQSLADMLIGKFRQEYHEFYTDPAKLAGAKAKLEELAWKALGELKVPRNKTIGLVVAAAIEKALSELDRELQARDEANKLLEKKFAEMFAAVAGVSSAFKTPPLVAGGLLGGPNVVVQDMCPTDKCTKEKGHTGEHGEGREGIYDFEDK